MALYFSPRRVISGMFWRAVADSSAALISASCASSRVIRSSWSLIFACFARFWAADVRRCLSDFLLRVLGAGVSGDAV